MSVSFQVWNKHLEKTFSLAQYNFCLGRYFAPTLKYQTNLTQGGGLQTCVTNFKMCDSELSTMAGRENQIETDEKTVAESIVSMAVGEVNEIDTDRIAVTVGTQCSGSSEDCIIVHKIAWSEGEEDESTTETQVSNSSLINLTVSFSTNCI